MFAPKPTCTSLTQWTLEMDTEGLLRYEIAAQTNKELSVSTSGKKGGDLESPCGDRRGGSYRQKPRVSKNWETKDGNRLAVEGCSSTMTLVFSIVLLS